MAQRVYKIAEFSKSKASGGCLCAMLKIQDVIDHQLIGKTIKNIEDDGSPGLYYHGTGICKFSNGLYVLTINGISYTFDNNGIGSSSNAKDYMLLNCTVEKDLIFIGNTAKSRSSSTVTTTDEGTSVVEQYGEQKNIVVNGLNARDQFAIQALQFLVAKEKNPSSLGDNEITDYCDAAYRWAANMMEAAANARAEYKDKTSASVSSDDLGSNTEKLLYDIQNRLEEVTETLTEKLEAIADAISEQV